MKLEAYIARFSRFILQRHRITYEGTHAKFHRTMRLIKKHLRQTTSLPIAKINKLMRGVRYVPGEKETQEES